MKSIQFNIEVIIFIMFEIIRTNSTDHTQGHVFEQEIRACGDLHNTVILIDALAPLNFKCYCHKL